MLRSLICAALVAAGPALAGDLVLKNKDNGAELRLYETQCSHGETMALLKEEWRAKFKNARVRDERGHILFYGCWILHDEETVVVFLQDGSHIGLSRSAFTDPSI